ncbi:DNA sulfur modification protein DndB [Maribacter forsetii]|uniref:DNA sulfur modification protein DndB n=1 Tax=Maribacter forsetii TaxID=444515 RepID=UPI00055B8FE5|nr:DNA sulfur modification protein DndB [Maribacter forsetii]
MKKYKIALPCLRGVIGDWVYYSSLMSAKQIKESVSTVKEIREATNLDEVLQRKLKERKTDIARYILNNESRFFNSIILGVFGGVPNWIEFDLGEKFEDELSSDDIQTSENSMGIMVFEGNENIFAIDGQHRVEGIKIALDKDVEKIKDDQYSVLFIAHIDDEEGRIRTRRLFSDINTNAKPVSKGDRIIIDEDDIKAIVARKLYKSLKYFKGGDIISVSEQSNLAIEDNEYFTNLIALHTVNKHLSKLYKIPRGEKGNDKVHVDAFYKIAENFYSFVFENLDEFSNYFIKNEITIKQARENNSHLLYRPIGLVLIAKIYVNFITSEIDLDKFKNLNKLSFIFPESHLNGILWNSGKMDVRMKNQNLAFHLTLYMLNEYAKDKTDDLLKNYREILKNEDAILPDPLT